MYGNNAGLATDPNTSSSTMSGDNYATGNVSARHQETMAQLNRTVSQAEELLRALGNESGEAIEAMRARVSSTLRDARERLLLSVWDADAWGDMAAFRAWIAASEPQPAAPEIAEPLYDYFVESSRTLLGRVETGSFRKTMQVELVNDGPVTILLDSRKMF